MCRHLYWSLSLGMLAAALGLTSARTLGATSYSIVTFADDFTVNGNCTLREAVAAATTNLPVDACAAGSAAGADTITLAAGTYPLPLGQIDATTDEELTIRGPAVDPPAAILSGGTTNRILDLHSSSGRLTLEDLELRDGNGLSGINPLGGAVRAGGASVVARRVLFFANRARRGGALAWYATGATKSLVIESCRFESNQALHPDAADEARGGALWLDPTDPATIRVADSDFVGNRAFSALAGDQVSAGAILLVTEGTGAVVSFERLRFSDNVAESSGSGGRASSAALDASVSAADFAMEDIEMAGSDLGATPLPEFESMVLYASAAATARLDRVRMVGQSGVGSVSELRQGFFFASGASSVLRMRNMLVTGGANGIFAAADGDAILFLDHLTVADNSGRGLELSEGNGASVFLDNSILFGNGLNLVIEEGAPQVAAENLVGIDPLFSDSQNGDYSLAEGSPAEDAGDTGSGIGPYDLAHAARVVGPETDLGAFERGALFSDGFEAGTVASWSW